ncbi:twin-arginine translocase subunit TatC [Microbacterium bovistercoris]|uniref:Sec-independent protein translocase protein TatC n=1 Tax=Microbacterium bovistercoris TaxID=2293570 RepID=A0A371NTA8_9MICO|nr:twin-arginine translocase subunit TatC [Microbacterium bovistercoris]REJ05534.1 twin-arginine translocase subunit TatC [Microbacterium bovistercoris]
MSLGAHLRELRKRLTIAAITIVVAMIVAFFVTDPIIDFISRPIADLQNERGVNYVSLNFGTVTAAFDLRMRMAFAIGLTLAAPVWLWQIWAFIMPGLTRKEVKYTIGFVAAAIPLFFAGCYTAMIVSPHVIEMLVGFTPQTGTSFMSAREYYDFIFKLMIVVGISFVTPVFMIGLNMAGILTGKAIFKGWRWAILVAIVFSAIATPPADVVSMFLLAGILTVLYFAAGGLALIFDKRKRKRMIAMGLDPDLPA